MSAQVPTHEDIERVIIITTDALRWDSSERHRDIYPPGTWFRGTSQATYTPASHASMFTSMNPPRTGVLQFGDPLNHANIFTQVEDSFSTSGVTDPDCWEPDMDPQGDDGHGFMPVHGIEQDYVGFMWMGNDDHEREKMNRYASENALVFAHDWMVHSSEMDYDRSWSRALEDVDEDNFSPTALENNEQSYETCVQKSADLHEQFFEDLQDEGLYEDTLFVMWGDHGQGLGHPPVHSVHHCTAPTESSCRVPIGFASPLFEETNVDETTNARGIDIWPTLTSIMDDAAISYEPMPHDVEGVDLTRFDGSLYGYSVTLNIRKTGFGDAITTDEHVLLDHDLRKLFGRTETDSGYVVSEPIENDLLMSELDQQRRLVRRETTNLIRNQTPNEAQMEAMGYL